VEIFVIAIVPRTCWVVQNHKIGASDVAKWVAIDEMSSEHKDSISGALLHVLWDRRLEWVPCGERQQHNNGERLFFSTARQVFLMVDRILV
jgi:hypothetical protein